MNRTVDKVQDGKKRYTEVDIARGVGILFVVLGHAIKQTQVSAGWIRVLTYIIYSFHMPLFFCLSGFVSSRILTMDRKQRQHFIADRAWRLLVPYFVIGLLYIPVKLKFSAQAVYHSGYSEAFDRAEPECVTVVPVCAVYYRGCLRPGAEYL